MRHRLAWALLASTLLSTSHAWVSTPTRTDCSSSRLGVATEFSVAEAEQSEISATHTLTKDLISKLRFRELRRQLEGRHLDPTGTTGQLRTRLRESAFGVEECVVAEDGDQADCEVSSRHCQIESDYH
jgi:hypothetical protein